MDETMRAKATELRGMASVDATDWLLQRYPDGGDGITLLEHISLRRNDTVRLARRYLSGPTSAHNRPYRLFAERLGLMGLVRILSEQEALDRRDAELLGYHLGPLIRDCADADERREATNFVAGLNSF